MARFLFSVLPTRGHIYPSLPIAFALRAAGHDVAYTTLPEFAHLLEPAGISVFTPERETGSGQAAPARPERRAEDAGREAAKQAFRAAFISTIPAHVRTLRQATAVWQPDVLVNDYVTFAPLMVSELEQRPIATLNQSISTWPGDDFAPFWLGLPRAHDAATRAHYAVLRQRGESFFADILHELNAMRASFGLPPRHGALAMATHSPYLQLILTVPALDADRDDLPPQTHYVGPCPFDPPTPPDEETAQWLAALPSARPLILVAASGAFTRSVGLVEAALAAFAQSETSVLATLPFPHPLHHQPTPPHVSVSRFVSHSQVLPHARAVVTHGGFGTVSKALGHGVPLVVVPYAGDQPEVAQRVVAAGAGLRLDPAGLTATTLQDAVSNVIREQRYHASARSLAAAMQRHDGPGEAARLLVQLAATRRPVVRDGGSTEAGAEWAQAVGS